jgi:sarcosine oxidase subunit gamma
MASFDLDARSPLHGFISPGRFGRPGGAAGLFIAERTDLALASVTARLGKAEALAAVVLAQHGIALPAGPHRADQAGVAFAGVGVGRWLASAEGPEAAGFVQRLKDRLAAVAAVSDQSDAYAVLRVSGPRVRAVLAKGVPIDLHPRAFKQGAAASTLVAHFGMRIEQLDDAPSYQLMASRSLAGSLWSWLTASAAEFGYEIAAPR